MFMGGEHQLIVQSLTTMGINDIHDFISTEYIDIPEFEYDKEDGTSVPLKKSEQLKLMKLLRFSKHLFSQQITTEQWLALT